MLRILVSSLLMALAFGVGGLPNFGSLGHGLEVRSAEAAPEKKSRRRRSRSRRRRSPPKAKPKAIEPEPTPAAPLPSRGPTRIDFDDRLVQGQTNQSGAVVLFARKATGLRSMVDRRKSFRERTIRTIFDR